MKKVINYAMFICMLVLSILIIDGVLGQTAAMDVMSLTIIVGPVIIETAFITTVLIPDIQTMQKKNKSKKSKQKKNNTEFKVLEKESA